MPLDVRRFRCRHCGNGGVGVAAVGASSSSSSSAAGGSTDRHEGSQQQRQRQSRQRYDDNNNCETQLRRSISLRLRRRRREDDDGGGSGSRNDNHGEERDSPGDGDDGASPAETATPLVDTFLGLVSEERDQLRRIESCRRLLNDSNAANLKRRQRQSNCKNKNMGDGDNAAQVAANSVGNDEVVSKEELRRLELRRSDTQSQLQQCLLRLPNYVDEGILVKVATRKRTTQQQQQERNGGDDRRHHRGRRLGNLPERSLPLMNGGENGNDVDDGNDNSAAADDDQLDVFYCIGGYEDVQVILPIKARDGDGSALTTAALLTDKGVQLVRALESMVVEYFSTCCSALFPGQQQDSTVASAEAVRVLHVPLEFPTTTFASSTTSLTATPAWKVLVQNLRGQTLYDRTLPFSYLLVCEGGPKAVPEPLTERKKKNRSNGKSSDRVWHNRLTTTQRTEVQILVVTGSSLETDSCRAQMDCMYYIQEFYEQQVLLNENGMKTSAGNDDKEIEDEKAGRKSHIISFLMATTAEIRAIPPDQLEPDEASRLVLELKYGTDTIVLATLSNYLDYYSDNIRHGNIPKHNVHVLHGRLCAVPECLDWMLRVQHQRQRKWQRQQVEIPKPLLPFLGLNLQSPNVLKYVRTVKKGKRGQRIVQPVLAVATADTSVSDVPAAPNSARGETMPIQGQLPNNVTHQRSRMIRAEACACPFDFLSFYYR